jgi:hypothetical protein
MVEALISSEGKVLDAGKLLRMRGYLDLTSFRDIIGEFEIAIEQRLLNLQSLELSPSQIEAICHDLITFTGTLGMCQVMSVAEKLREFARQHAQADMLSAQADMKSAGERAMAALRAYMEGAGD